MFLARSLYSLYVHYMVVTICLLKVDFSLTKCLLYVHQMFPTYMFNIITIDKGRPWSIVFQILRNVLTNVDYTITASSLYVPCTFTIWPLYAHSRLTLV